jgi:hypothetical protein
MCGGGNGMSGRKCSGLCVGRRGFLAAGVSTFVGTAMFNPLRSLAAAGDQPELNMRRGAKPLVVKPILTYETPRRVPRRSWRNWGGVHTKEAAEQERGRIETELKKLADTIDCELKILPVLATTNPEQAAKAKSEGADVALIYAAGGWMNLIQAACGAGRWPLFFIRHHSGPYYLWHEIIHARFLRAHSDEFKQQQVTTADVVVDDYAELAWRLRALFGLKNTLGRRIVCIGGPGGWACPQAPERAKERFQLQMITVEIAELNKMIEQRRKSAEHVARSKEATERYLKNGVVALKTSKEAVAETFLLRDLFYDLMKQHKAFAVTVRGCMGSYAGIMPCLTLTLINDDGYMAYCEGDFVVIPSGILAHFISGKPTYFCNPTFPHHGRMMFAHCTAPRRMDGKRLEPVELVTHYESDHGAATHVLFRKGQLVTIIKPDFAASNWMVTRGKVVGTPFINTCRAQIEVQLSGDQQAVLENMRGFHCMIIYGDYTREVPYAAAKVGIQAQVI